MEQIKSKADYFSENSQYSAEFEAPIMDWEDASVAMDEYAEGDAIAFAEWIYFQGYKKCYGYPGWYDKSRNSTEILQTAELYKLYKTKQ